MTHKATQIKYVEIPVISDGQIQALSASIVQLQNISDDIVESINKAKIKVPQPNSTKKGLHET